jgi:hypothetical protein
MSADSLNAPPDYPAAAQGNLIINLDITGDPSTGPSTYPATLDGFAWRDLDIGENRFLVAAGTHTVALVSSVVSLFYTDYQSWCTATSLNRYTGVIAGGVPTTVSFSLDCPPLVGTGVLRLSYTVSGSGTATEMPVNLMRLNGPTLSSSVNVPPDKLIDVTLPVGLYRVSTNGSGSCTPSNTFVYLGMPVRAVRNGAVAAVNFPLTCK